MAPTQDLRRERVEWAMTELEKAQPGVPLPNLKRRIAARFMVSPYTVRGDMDALLGQPGVFLRSGFVCLKGGGE